MTNPPKPSGSGGPSPQSSGRCSRCRSLYPAPGSDVCSYCLLRATDPDGLGPVDVEAPLRDREQEERNAGKIVQFGIGLVSIVVIFGGLVLVQGVGPTFTPVSAETERAFQIFAAVVAVASLALVRPVTTRLLRWLNKHETPHPPATPELPDMRWHALDGDDEPRTRPVARDGDH